MDFRDHATTGVNFLSHTAITTHLRIIIENLLRHGPRIIIRINFSHNLLTRLYHSSFAPGIVHGAHYSSAIRNLNFVASKFDAHLRVEPLWKAGSMEDIPVKILWPYSNFLLFHCRNILKQTKGNFFENIVGGSGIVPDVKVEYAFIFRKHTRINESLQILKLIVG